MTNIDNELYCNFNEFPNLFYIDFDPTLLFKLPCNIVTCNFGCQEFELQDDTLLEQLELNGSSFSTSKEQRMQIHPVNRDASQCPLPTPLLCLHEPTLTKTCTYPKGEYSYSSICSWHELCVQYYSER